MQASVTLLDHRPVHRPPQLVPATGDSSQRERWPFPLEQERGDPSERYRHVLSAWTAAVDRAERAERRLRSRLLPLTWPATLSRLAGGFAAILALRLAGF